MFVIRERLYAHPVYTNLTFLLIWRIQMLIDFGGGRSVLSESVAWELLM